MKIFKILLIFIIAIHFLLISTGQLRELNFFKTNFSKQINDFYIEPYFEQNWGMFSPNPPKGNQYFIIKYKTETDSINIDIHDKVREGSIMSIFNINQRLLKYQSECYNDILRKLETKKINFSKIDIQKSHGLESILNYSLIVLKKQKKFLNNINISDSIKVDIYLVDEPLSNPNSKKKFEEKRYIELKNIYLTKMSNL